MKIAWIDTLVDYPIYGNLDESALYNSSFDISLPLAFVYLRTFVETRRPDIEFIYYPRRLLAAEGIEFSIDDAVLSADVVATSCSAADSDDAHKILQCAKRHAKITIIGGIFPRFSSQRIMEWGVVDYCVTGEGELPFLEIIDQIRGRPRSGPWSGVSTPNAKEFTPAPLVDLTTLPVPDYSGLPIKRFQKFMKSAYILATRGCPAPCHFCTSARLYGYSYRKRDVESVVEELRGLADLGFTKISFADDTIAVDRKWLMRLLASLIQERLPLRFKVRTRADELDCELLQTMEEAGVEVIQFGVESMSLTTRLSMHKRLEQNAIEQAFHLILDKTRMKANPLFMLAYPGETRADLEYNSKFICEVGSNPRVITYMSFTTPYPDTAFSTFCREGQGTILTDNLRYYTNKFPVFLPSALVDSTSIRAFDTLVDAYNEIALQVNRSHQTQSPIPESYLTMARQQLRLI